MAHQPTQTVVETDVFGNNEDWGEDNDYYDQQADENGRRMGTGM